MSHTPRRRRAVGRNCTHARGEHREHRRPGGGRSRPSPRAPRRTPDPRQPLSFVAHPLQPHPVIDAIASQLTGQKINAGIALIDQAWAAGESLDPTLAIYTRIAHAAFRRYTAGLWTLIAWINWRTNNRPDAWTALHLALAIDPDEGPAHYLAVFMYDQVDPSRIRPVGWPP